ncbi:MAG: hypothetical protein ACFFBY_08010 [Promethearchaeota archaeon]
MVKIQIRCPACSKSNFVEVSDDEVKKASKGLFAVNVAEGIVCEHSFVAYVDKNFAVRDAFIADFQIELPSTMPEETVEKKSELSKLFDIDLIKLNLTASLLGYVLKAMIFKKKIVLISNQQYLFNQISNFFHYLTENSFGIDLILISEAQYDKSSYGNHFAFKGREIITDFEGKLQTKKINVEKTIIQKFLNEYDPMTSLIILKNEIQKAFQLSKTIVEFIHNLKENERLYSKKLITELEKKHNIKIAIPYLDFLYEIVENYFEVQIPKTSGISNFLGTL